MDEILVEHPLDHYDLFLDAYSDDDLDFAGNSLDGRSHESSQLFMNSEIRRLIEHHEPGDHVLHNMYDPDPEDWLWQPGAGGEPASPPRRTEESVMIDDKRGREDGDSADDGYSGPAQHLGTIQRIEEKTLDLLRQIAAALPTTEQELNDMLHSKSRDVKKLVLKLADRRKSTANGECGCRTFYFPRGANASITPFAQLFRVADLAHEALIEGIPTTKRDAFYRDVQLFKKQNVVDKLVDDLAATIDVQRADLNVRASSKGLVCAAALAIHIIGGDVVRTMEYESTLIPVSEDIASLDLPADPGWVLIVEKEAVFQTLRQLRFVRHHRLPGTGIMITGKGYPDLATRQLVKRLSDILPPTVPIVALVDGDAYGLDIASVYKFGSAALRHESHQLVTPRVNCIGVWASELTPLGIDKDALIPISRADEKKARSMLRRDLPQKWKRELVHMLHSRRKAETEILCNAPRDPNDPHPLVRYLTDKINDCILALASELPELGASIEDDGDNNSLFEDF
ncbi:Spo11/DNA topoisomerase VI subunit A [Gloeopeniophorella convolvens]|nr:Spo11/DNA topoisomerase VI subunit A [Gloeopeniophorella convolvens]